MKTILSEQQISLTVKRLAHQILEDHLQLKDTVIIGIQPRGVYLSDRIINELSELVPPASIQYGKLDITFYRDDIRKELHVANKTDIPFGIENKHVVIIDDVLYKGRTIRAALDALLDFGRPLKVGLFWDLCWSCIGKCKHNENNKYGIRLDNTQRLIPRVGQ